MQNDFNVIVFISGRGSNLRSLVNSAKHYNITHVLSNNPNAPGILFAREHGISTISRAKSEFSSLKEQKQWLYAHARATQPSLIILAGFMQIIEQGFVEEFSGRMINIHPSLLPAYPGLDTHRRAIDEGASHHGCTVHYVDGGVDTGPIIAQVSCNVLPSDTEETLAEKILKEEHRLLPWVVKNIATGDIFIDKENKVVFSDKALKSADENHFLTGRPS